MESACSQLANYGQSNALAETSIVASATLQGLSACNSVFVCVRLLLVQARQELMMLFPLVFVVQGQFLVCRPARSQVMHCPVHMLADQAGLPTQALCMHI